MRIGINAGIDNLVIDINDQRNIAGAGISMASRIMGVADGNQILVGQTVFETLRYRDKYMSAFKPFRARIKHNMHIQVYQFISEGFAGLNTNTPSTFQSSTILDNRQSDQFVSQTSNLGILCLHICLMAFREKKPFNLQQLCSELRLLNYDYATGFLVACVSSGWLEVRQSNEFWTVLDVEENIQHRMENLAQQRADTITNQSTKESYMIDYAQIALHFITA